MCYMTKCPYVPPHPWNVDFPHLMLRAKAVQARRGELTLADRLLSSTDTVGRIAGIPVVAEIVNAVNRNRTGAQAAGPDARGRSAARRCRSITRAARGGGSSAACARASAGAAGRRYPRQGGAVHHLLRQPQRAGAGEDLVAVFEHNGIPLVLAAQERCCGMPKLELGDLESVARAKEQNIPMLLELVDEG